MDQVNYLETQTNLQTQLQLTVYFEQTENFFFLPPNYSRIRVETIENFPKIERKTNLLFRFV